MFEGFVMKQLENLQEDNDIFLKISVFYIQKPGN
jgi:hypothetical protein